MDKLKLAFDSARSFDDNGFMHVKVSHITKATVNPYYGCEIPNWQELGLDANKIYYALRDPKELEKSRNTWAGLPLHLTHHTDDANDPQKMSRVGTVGTDVKWNDPYLDAPLTIWDKDAIDKIQSGKFKELSCAYRYDPDFTSGFYNGEPYDFVMRNIRGNHVALVEEGRAGSDVVVADSKDLLTTRGNEKMTDKLLDADQDKDKAELGKEMVDLGQKLQEGENQTDNTVHDSDDMQDLKEKYNLDDDALNDIIARVSAKQEPAQDNDDVDAQDEGEDVKAQDEEEIIADALKACGIEGASDELKDAFKAGIEYAKKKSEGAQDEGEDVKAQDAEEEKPITKEDIKIAEDRAIRRMKEDYKARSKAVTKVAPLVGRLDPMAFDSANGIYKYALEKKGISTAGRNGASLEAMVDVLMYKQVGSIQRRTGMAQDSRTSFEFEKNLQNIRVED